MYTLEKAWRLTKAQYDNLLPVMRKNLLARRFADHEAYDDEYSFIGTPDEYADALRRCAYLD
jgi:alkanesulfonate monooxygenase SsuD/methylene tetrahydromethanopterin reductase-like flavin-dependent oxidoreductase (luciferase family)